MTRRKRLGEIKPRNPVARHAQSSGIGIHGKTRKAQRRADRVQFKKQIRDSSIQSAA